MGILKKFIEYLTSEYYPYNDNDMIRIRKDGTWSANTSSPIWQRRFMKNVIKDLGYTNKVLNKISNHEPLTEEELKKIRYYKSLADKM